MGGSGCRGEGRTAQGGRTQPEERRWRGGASQAGILRAGVAGASRGGGSTRCAGASEGRVESWGDGAYYRRGVGRGVAGGGVFVRKGCGAETMVGRLLMGLARGGLWGLAAVAAPELPGWLIGAGRIGGWPMIDGGW